MDVSFEEALAEALERCSLGEPPEAAAAAVPQFDLVPYLGLAGRLRDLACPSAAEWVEHSLERLCSRMD
jgi:hypothetical protein